MKELESKDRINDKIQIEAIIKKKKQIEYVLEDSLIPMNGHTLYEINVSTLEIKEAKFIQEKTITLAEAMKIIEGKENREILLTPHCVYISSLNKKNAMDRFHKKKGSSGIGKGIMDIKDLFW